MSGYLISPLLATILNRHFDDREQPLNTVRPHPPFRAIVWSFSLSQTISWATMFYIFPAMMVEWETNMGWTKTQLSGALTLAMLLSAIIAPVAGRLIDHGHIMSVNVGATFAAILLLAALSQIEYLWQFYFVWAGLGIAIAGVLYEPCFAILTRVFQTRASMAITRVTLAAGFAGTIAFPSVHFLIGAYGWRVTVLVAALTLAVLALPSAWFACKNAQKYLRTHQKKPPQSSAVARATLSSFTFWLLALAYICFALDHSMLLSHLLPLLAERQVEPSYAVFAASLIGPMQVAGRILMLLLHERVSSVVIANIALCVMILAATLLYFSDLWIGLILLFVLLQGAGVGVTSIIRPMLSAELLGRENFGLISGLIAIPFIGAFAFGPSVSALTWELVGYDGVILLAIGLCLIGIVALLAANGWRQRKN